MVIAMPPSPFRIELAATVRLGAPLAAANLLQMAVYAIDVIFVGHLGTAELAAITLSTAVYGLALWCAMGLLAAVAPLAASALGRGRHAVRDVRRSIRMALWMSVLAGLFVMAVCVAGEPLMDLTGQPQPVARLAGEYLNVIAWASIPVLAASVLRIFVSALNKAAIATGITVLALFVNAGCNWVLIFGKLGFPALGLEGAALASVFTAFVVLAAYIAVIQSDRRMRRHYLFGRLWRADPQRLAEIWRIGLPIAAITLAEGGLFGAAAFLMGAIGKLELAAHTIALQIAALSFQVPVGIAQAATIRVGLHRGAGDRDGIARAGIAALVLTAGFACIFAAAMLLMPGLLLSIYLDADLPANAALAGLAVQYLLIAAAFQLFDGTQAVAAGLLRGLADTRMPFLMAVAGYWACGFATAFVLGFHTPLGGAGVWIGLAVGLVITSAMLLLRWHMLTRPPNSDHVAKKT